MRYEGLIQAFSRTNRLDDEDKPHGTICYYRKPNIMQKNIEDAFKLYAGEQAFYVFVYKLEENVKVMNRIADEIKSIFEMMELKIFRKLLKQKQDVKSLLNYLMNIIKNMKLQEFKVLNLVSLCLIKL